MAVYFHTTDGEWGALSNFAPFGVDLDGEYWPTVEHYYQAQKFAAGDAQRRILLARSPRQAARLGRDRSVPIRPDWEQARVSVMRRALVKKFETHRELQELLLSTGDEDIVECPGDPFWGVGADGVGSNTLGRLLMEIRTELRGLETRAAG